MTRKLKTRDFIALTTIAISLAGLLFIYVNVDFEVHECKNAKTEALNKIIEGYPDITNPVIKNRIDKQCNKQMSELENLKNAPTAEQRELCGLEVK
ncbi:Peptide chain release factor 3 [Moritella viscosa]|uniref:hypothetical protein n=1 Tax=Moritella viscosa TaxID=80854 RepID=UPI0009215402|nr:hypothetical protein [Moritella viscosa]SHO28249.1 Peptide chain release factor 3 [Moritella viscosa]